MTKANTTKYVLLIILTLAVGYGVLWCVGRLYGGVIVPRVTIDEASDLEDFDQNFRGIIELEDADDSFIQHWQNLPPYSRVRIESGRLSYGLLKAILGGADEDQLQLYVAREVEVEKGACEPLVEARIYSLRLYSAHLSSADIENLGAVGKAFTVDFAAPRDIRIETLEPLAKNASIYRVGLNWDSVQDSGTEEEIKEFFRKNGGAKVSFAIRNESDGSYRPSRR